MSQRKIPYMILNNYKYVKHRSSQRSTYWKCQRYDGDFRVSVLSSLNGLQYTTYQILNIVKEILKSSSDISFEMLTVPENLPNFPLNSYEEYLRFNDLIKEDTHISQYMVRRLAALGGSGIDSITRRIMRFLFDNELATQFNWKGRHNKTGFEGTAIMGLVYGYFEYPKFSTTTRGRKCLILSNYVFYVNQVTNSRCFWMCRSYYHTKCKARCVTTVDDQLYRVSKNHNHPPDCDGAQPMLTKTNAFQ